MLNPSPSSCHWEYRFGCRKRKCSCFCCSAAVLRWDKQSAEAPLTATAALQWSEGRPSAENRKQLCGSTGATANSERGGKMRRWKYWSMGSEAVRSAVPATLWVKKSVSIFLRNNSRPDTPFPALSFWFHIPIFISHLPLFLFGRMADPSHMEQPAESAKSQFRNPQK